MINEVLYVETTLGRPQHTLWSLICQRSRSFLPGPSENHSRCPCHLRYDHNSCPLRGYSISGLVFVKPLIDRQMTTIDFQREKAQGCHLLWPASPVVAGLLTEPPATTAGLLNTGRVGDLRSKAVRGLETRAQQRCCRPRSCPYSLRTPLKGDSFPFSLFRDRRVGRFVLVQPLINRQMAVVHFQRQ